MAARDQGVLGAGVDISARAVEGARRAGLDVHRSDLAGAPGHLRALDIITAIDVVEHVANPDAFLAAAFERLRPGGLVYLETPNPSSWVYRLGSVLARIPLVPLGSIISRLFPAEHVQYFTGQGIRAAAARAGLAVVAVQARQLPAADIAASPLVRAGVTGLQVLDRLTGRRGALLWAVLRRPEVDAVSQVSYFDLKK